VESHNNQFYPNPPKAQFSVRNRLRRFLWGIVWCCLFRLSPRFAFGWRRFLLRAFGAQIDATAQVYPSARIWAPWNLAMHRHAALGEFVDCQSVDRVTLEAEAVVSQYVHLCTASHDMESPGHETLTGPIHLAAGSWVFAGAFIGKGVTIGRGAVVAARSVVVKSVAPFEVVGGNPARLIKQRKAEWLKEKAPDA
jgi:putative colanic acid biosynthesis acetyltransferase WcaF